MAPLSRRGLLRSLAAGAASFALPARQKTRRPNVILILADDQGYGDVSCHGNRWLQTPNLDRLAAEGTEFTRFHVSPVCAPTRSSLLTGRYHLRVGVHGVTAGRETLRTEELTVAEVLKSGGYRTALFGKWHLGEHYPYVPHAQGFDEFIGFRTGHWIDYFDPEFERNGEPYPLKGYVTEALTEQAIAFVERNRTRPFFLYLPYNVPHSPFQVPEKYWKRFEAMDLPKDTAAAYALTACMDDQIGRLLAALDQQKLAEDTIVIFLSDNGPNGQRYNAGLRGAKGSVYEGGTRVPMFIRWPGVIAARKKVDRIAAHIDMHPTLLDLCGVKRPDAPALDGKSLAPLLRGIPQEQWPDRMLFSHMERRGAGEKFPGAVKTQRFNLVDGTELYDLQADPGETRNVAEEYPEKLAELRAAYDRWYAGVLPPGGLRQYPIPVGYDQENPVTLSMPQAHFTGGVKYFQGNGWAHDWATNWRMAGDAAEWHIDVVKGGRYQAEVAYLSAAENRGSRFILAAGASSTDFAVAEPTSMEKTGAPDIVPRRETHRMHWRNVPAGTLTLKEGLGTLKLAYKGGPGAPGLEIRSLTLRRIG